MIFRIQRGENGAVLHRERTIPFQDIQSIDMRRHRYSIRGFLFMDVLIRKVDGKLMKIPAYSILDEEVFEQTVKQEIYPSTKGLSKLRQRRNSFRRKKPFRKDGINCGEGSWFYLL
ncbi:hypothetical protein BSAF29S_03206 [Bacillus safensis subsp. safensis]